MRIRFFLVSQFLKRSNCLRTTSPSLHQRTFICRARSVLADHFRRTLHRRRHRQLLTVPQSAPRNDARFEHLLKVHLGRRVHRVSAGPTLQRWWPDSSGKRTLVKISKLLFPLSKITNKIVASDTEQQAAVICLMRVKCRQNWSPWQHSNRLSRGNSE